MNPDHSVSLPPLPRIIQELTSHMDTLGEVLGVLRERLEYVTDPAGASLEPLSPALSEEHAPAVQALEVVQARLDDYIASMEELTRKLEV